MHNKFQNSELYLRVLSSIIMIVLSALLLVLGGILFEISLILLAAILAWEILGFDDNKNKLKILNASLFAFSFATYIWFLPILSLIFLFIFLLYYKIIIKHEDFNKRAIYFIVILLSLVSLSHLSRPACALSVTNTKASESKPAASGHNSVQLGSSDSISCVFQRL